MFDFNTAVWAALVAFAICVILGPVAIPVLKRLKLGQNVRDDGPKTHLKKAGIPSMGGIVIIIAILLSSFYFSMSSEGHEWQLVMFLMVSYGLIGFLDDYIKIVKRRSLGLRAYQKFSLQILAATVFVILLILSGASLEIFVPFSDGIYLDLGFFAPLFMVFTIVGTANGANFTDGADGLASGVTLLIALFFLYIAIASESYLVATIAAAAGALLGFLLFNSYPAKVFMGDTGSLALGGLVSAVAIILQMPLLIVIVAFVYLAEVLSVIIQVGYFKMTKGKRFFKMAPIHHHFEQLGWPETKVVAVFYIVTAILCLLGFLAVNNLFI